MSGNVEHVDVVVIGSGFGGSVTAYRLAEAGLRVCVLERGRRWPPGSFARSPAAMKRNFWDPSRGLYGLFNVWSFDHIEAVVGAGLGGGSLIYANVLLRKDENWFYDESLDGSHRPWPISRRDLDPHYDAVESVLRPVAYPYETTLKTTAMAKAGAGLGLATSRPPIAVAFSRPGERPEPGQPLDRANLHDRFRSTCHGCGECDIGCNTGAKNTLDYNYLSMAQKAGADLRSACEVTALRPRQGGGYEVDWVRHDVDDPTPSPTRDLVANRITADKVVVAAGTLGSTYLLLKNRQAFPGLSPAIGTRFCGNGDLLGFITGAANAIDPSVGPVITTAVRSPDIADGGGGPGFYVEEGGYPDFLNWVLVTQPSPRMLSKLIRAAMGSLRARLGRDRRTDISGQLSRLLPDEDTRNALPLLGMGRDVADGLMTVGRNERLDIDWDMRSSRPLFDRMEATMRGLALEMGGELTESPLSMLKRVVTVHPLGGCPMGTDSSDGVVDPHGEVFGYPGLYVADGAVMPGPVGPNPSLTIAALANRFADRMIGV